MKLSPCLTVLKFFRSLDTDNFCSGSDAKPGLRRGLKYLQIVQANSLLNAFWANDEANCLCLGTEACWLGLVLPLCAESPIYFLQTILHWLAASYVHRLRHELE